MKVEYRIVDKMLMEGTLKIRDFKKILETKMYPIEAIYFSIFSAKNPKYIVVFASYYGNYYREEIREYLNSLDKDIKTILDIYDVWPNFSILNYQTKIENGTVDDIYRFIMILHRDYPYESVENIISYLLEKYPLVKEKYNYNLFIMSLKDKTLKEFIEILNKNKLLEYFLKYKDIESFNDLKDIYYLLEVLNIEDINQIKERLRNKILNFLNKTVINQEMLMDIEKISKEIGLETFVLAFTKLHLAIPIKTKIIKCLAEYFFKSQDLLEEYYDRLEKINEQSINSIDKDFNTKTNMIIIPNKVYRKLYKSVDNEEEKNYN